MKPFLPLAFAFLVAFSAHAAEGATEAKVSAMTFVKETFDALPASTGADLQARLDRVVQRFPELRQTPAGENLISGATAIPLTAVTLTAVDFAEFADRPELLAPALAFAERMGDWNDIAYLTFYRLNQAEALTAEAWEALLARCEAATPRPEAAIEWINLRIGLSPQVPIARRLEALRNVIGYDLPYAMVLQAAQERFALQATTFVLPLPRLLPPVETSHRYLAEHPRPVTFTLTAEDGALVRAWTLEPKTPEGRMTLPALPEGAYTLSAESVGAYTQAPLQATHRFIVGRAAPFRLTTSPETFLVLDTLTGQPLPGVSLAYHEGNRLLGAGVSDARGLLRFPTPNVDTPARLRAEVTFQGHTSTVEGDAWQAFDLSPVPPPVMPRLDLRLDRRFCRAGDTLRYWGYLSDDRGRALATQTTLTVTAYPPDASSGIPGRPIASIPITTGADGLFSGSVQTPNDLPAGVITFAISPTLGTRALILPERGAEASQAEPSRETEHDEAGCGASQAEMLRIPETPPKGSSPDAALTLRVTLPSAGKLRLFAWNDFLSMAVPLERFVAERPVPAGTSTHAFDLPQGIYLARLYADSQAAPIRADLFNVGPPATEDDAHDTFLRQTAQGAPIPTHETAKGDRPAWLALLCDQGLLGLHPLKAGEGHLPFVPALREGFAPVRLTLLENGLPHICALPEHTSPAGNDFSLTAEVTGNTLTIHCAEPTARLAVLVRDAATEAVLTQARVTHYFPDAWGATSRERLWLSRTEVPVQSFPLFGASELRLQESFVDTLSPDWPPEEEEPCQMASAPHAPLLLLNGGHAEKRTRRLKRPPVACLETSGEVASDPSVWGPSFPQIDAAKLRDTLLWRTGLIPDQGRATLPLPTLTAPAAIHLLAITPDGRSAVWTGPLAP